MNNKRYDFLHELKCADDTKREEISEKYPVLDKASKERIADLCEEKLKMSKNDIYNINDDENVVRERVEVCRKTPWYRSQTLAVAASLVLVVGAAGCIVSGLGSNNGSDKQLAQASTSGNVSLEANTKPALVMGDEAGKNELAADEEQKRLEEQDRIEEAKKEQEQLEDAQSVLTEATSQPVTEESVEEINTELETEAPNEEAELFEPTTVVSDIVFPAAFEGEEDPEESTWLYYDEDGNEVSADAAKEIERCLGEEE